MTSRLNGADVEGGVAREKEKRAGAEDLEKTESVQVDQEDAWQKGQVIQNEKLRAANPRAGV